MGGRAVHPGGLGWLGLYRNSGRKLSYDQSPTVITILCDMGLASLICLAGFAVLLVVYRIRLNGLREECRHSVKSLIEFQLNKSRVMAPGHDRSDPADAEIARRSPAVADFPEKVGSGER